MKNYFKLLFLIVFLSNFCFSQDEHFIDEIKLYGNYSFTETSNQSIFLSADSIYFQINESEKRLLNLTPTIVFGAHKGSAHEIAISKFNYTKRQRIQSYLQDGETYENLTEIGNDNIESFELQFRYEYKIGMFSSKNWKVKPKLGFSATPFINFSTITSNIATRYDHTFTQGGIGFSVIPRLEYKLNEKWYLDLNVPIHLSNLEFITQTVDNPLIRIENQTTTILNFTSHLIPILRLGIAFKI